MYAPEQGHGESRRGGFEAAPLSDVMHDLTGLLSHWALGLSAKDKKHSKTDVRMRGGSALTPETEFEEDVERRTRDRDRDRDPTKSIRLGRASSHVQRRGGRAQGRREADGGGSSASASSRDGLTLLYYTERMFAPGPFWKGHGDRGAEGVEVRSANNKERTDPGRHSRRTAQLASSVERDRTLS